MAERWARYRLTAQLLSDAHLGSGSGGVGIDALVARDRHGQPVIWASHVEGVLRDAARRLRGDKAAADFFGRAGGDYQRSDRQRAVFTSLYTKDNLESHVWRSTAREAFDNRAPKDDTLRVVEYVPRGTKLLGAVELPASELPVLQRLVQEVDALGGGRATGAGRVKLSLSEATPRPSKVGEPTGPPPAVAEEPRSTLHHRDGNARQLDPEPRLRAGAHAAWGGRRVAHRRGRSRDGFAADLGAHLGERRPATAAGTDEARRRRGAACAAHAPEREAEGSSGRGAVVGADEGADWAT